MSEHRAGIAYDFTKALIENGSLKNYKDVQETYVRLYLFQFDFPNRSDLKEYLAEKYLDQKANP